MFKLLSALVAIFTLSGCCELFGICTSVSVHSSISSPRQFAQADSTSANKEEVALAGSPLQLQSAAARCESGSR